MLDPIFNKEIQKKGRNLIIQLADKECEYSDTFCLFLCSKLTNPHYSEPRSGANPERASLPPLPLANRAFDPSRGQAPRSLRS